MANVEMKTLTIGENTYEIVDETARSGVEALETIKDMSSYSTLLEYVLANPFSRAYYKGYGLEDCILGNAWGTIITLSPQSGAGVLVFAFRNNDTHVYMRKTHYYNSVEEWNGDWLDITEMSEKLGSMEYFINNYTSITIDGVTYEGSTDVVGVKVYNPYDETRWTIFATVTGSANSDVWPLYIAAARPIVMKRVGDNYYGWNSTPTYNEFKTKVMGLKTDLGVDANQVAVLNTDGNYVMHFYKDGIWVCALHITDLNENAVKYSDKEIVLSDLTWNASASGMYYSNDIEPTNGDSVSLVLACSIKGFSGIRTTDNIVPIISSSGTKIRFVSNVNSFVGSTSSLTVRTIYRG